VGADPDIFLREESGPRCGRIHALRSGRQVIGRDPKAAVVLAGEDVSRFHAAVEVTPEAITVTDLGSKNGVSLAGTTRTGPVVLGHGEVFVVGGISLRVHHPGAQIDAALRRGGEVTVTRVRAPRPLAPQDRLALPVAATLFFAALVGALLVWQ
jgi:S-DNA-T family DNA segregation ATPase FtsK/SpoIIIE